MDDPRIRPFAERLRPAPVDGGYREDGHWVWCGSTVRGDDGRYHCFAARWPRRYPFFHGYLAASEVVRAVADRPEGPFRFAEVVLPARGAECWDGRMTHNPFVLRRGDEYLLYYIGTTYEGPVPDRATMEEHLRAGPGNGRMFPWYFRIRIGLARAPAPEGPWKRSDAPILDVNPDGWDHNVVTNPSPCLAPDGRILLYYRAGQCRLGLAIADDPAGPYAKVGDAPILDPGEGRQTEDPFVWWNGERYEMVAKDLTGDLVGEFHAGVHWHSPDGRDWRLAPRPKAWSRRLRWDDGSETLQANIERPYVLFEHGEPAWLYVATADGPGPHDGRPGFAFAEHTWNQPIPLG